MSERLIVVDYGSQYTRLIARRLRELDVFSEIVAPDAVEAALAASTPAGVVLSGGQQSVNDEGAPRLHAAVLDAGVPVLAICYGMQLIAQALGGTVAPSGVREYGKADLTHYDGTLFTGVEGDFTAWMSHGDSVTTPPPGFTVTASTVDTPVAAMEDASRGVYALQFHPEVRHTPKGLSLLERFVEQTGVARTWTPGNIVEQATEDVRAQVGDGRVLAAVSGGVDSSTLAMLLAKAIPDRLDAVFVDTCLLRMGEVDEVQRALEGFGVPLTAVDAKDEFLSALAGVTDPEEKRKRIGATFIDVFKREAARLQKDHGAYDFLAQGTLYPDVIESAGGVGAANIKSHHNVGGLPAELGFTLIEPFRTLFKDEVREVATTLGMPPALRDRHPFPGPGLAIRILGEVTEQRLEVLRRVDDIFIGSLRELGLYDATWQALAVLTPIRSVGVMGDGRTYAHTVALRAVTSIDGMTADWARLPHDALATISNRIVGQVPEVNRVVYDVTSKPPGTIEWE